MSITAGLGKLEEARKDLLRHWDTVRTYWHDPVSEKFEYEVVVMIDRKIKGVEPTLAQISDLLRKVHRECE